jgi:hypothetical protein
MSRPAYGQDRCQRRHGCTNPYELGAFRGLAVAHGVRRLTMPSDRDQSGRRTLRDIQASPGGRQTAGKVFGGRLTRWRDCGSWLGGETLVAAQSRARYQRDSKPGAVAMAEATTVLRAVSVVPRKSVARGLATPSRRLAAGGWPRSGGPARHRGARSWTVRSRHSDVP